MTSRIRLNHTVSRRKVLQSASVVAAMVASPSILRAQTKEIVIGCAASHAGWMKDVVAPVFEKKHKAKILIEGTKSLVNLEKMRSNKSKPYLSVVQMDDPVMILAVEEGLLEPLTPASVPNLAKLRKGAVHMDGMWANYVQPWAGIAHNTQKMAGGVPSWATMWEPAYKGKVIIPSLQNTEGMWTLFAAASLATGKPLEAAQYEIDAAFEKLKALKPNLLSIYSVMTQSFNLLEQGEISMLGGNWSAYTLPRKAKSAPVDLSAPKEGIFAMPSGICLVKGGPNRDLALAYINEMLGPELQKELADKTFALPANTDVKAGPTLPAGVPVFGPDWAFVSRNRKAWIERFDKLMAA